MGDASLCIMIHAMENKMAKKVAKLFNKHEFTLMHINDKKFVKCHL